MTEKPPQSGEPLSRGTWQSGLPLGSVPSYLNHLEAQKAAWQGEERRSREDRRGRERSGKFDRRKNRCATCQKYAKPGETASWCSVLNQAVQGESFACPSYEAIAPVF